MRIDHDTAVEVLAAYDAREARLTRTVTRRLGTVSAAARDAIVRQADDQTLSMTGHRVNELFM